MTPESSRADLDAGLTPEELVVGQPEVIEQAAAEADRMAEQLLDIRQALEYIEVDWEGEAAQAFRNLFDFQPDRFRDAALRFQEASIALSDYAATLAAAKAVASNAWALYRVAKAAMPQQLSVPTPYAPDYVAPGSSTPEMDHAVERLATARHEVARAATTTSTALTSARFMTLGETHVIAQRPDIGGDSGDLLSFAAGALRAVGDTAMLMGGNPDVFRPNNDLDRLEAHFGVEQDENYLFASILVGFWNPGVGTTRAPLLASLPWRRTRFGTPQLATQLAETGLAARNFAGLAGISMREPGALSHAAVYTIGMHADAIPPPTHWSAEATQRWVYFMENHPSRGVADMGTEASIAYERRGGGTQGVLISNSDGTSTVQADGLGIDADGVVALEMKYVNNPGNATSVHEGTMPVPHVQEQADRDLRDQLRRYGDVAADAGNPVDRIRIPTTSELAAERVRQFATEAIGDRADWEVVVMP
ncbi:WXG100 family type VII secretion target [Nocardioides alkalitolerans]|uniref:WXG100 family type VII secretion target n=1 Tax=Nocardioides alkalitolerans TaxID=281714 RepID=UPI0004091F1B|nr:WXG100 family type VII secretion target [Nocardioides alkalitolerans]